MQYWTWRQSSDFQKAVDLHMFVANHIVAVFGGFFCFKHRSQHCHLVTEGLRGSQWDRKSRQAAHWAPLRVKKRLMAPWKKHSTRSNGVQSLGIELFQLPPQRLQVGSTRVIVPAKITLSGNTVSLSAWSLTSRALSQEGWEQLHADEPLLISTYDRTHHS